MDNTYDPADEVILCPKCHRRVIEVVMDEDGLHHWYCEWCCEPVTVVGDAYFNRLSKGDPAIFEDWEV